MEECLAVAGGVIANERRVSRRSTDTTTDDILRKCRIAAEESMPISEMLLPEFDQEMANTRKILERVPEDKLSYKPHEKSMTLGRFAGHVAELPSWGHIP